MALTDKQKRFVDEYLVDFNATQAAIRAGYSQKTAKEMAHENLTKPHIQVEIQKRQKKIAKKNELKREDVIFHTQQLAYSDIRQIFDNDGTPIPPHELPDEIALAISRVERKQLPDGSIQWKYWFWDKTKSLEQLQKIIGLHNNHDAGVDEIRNLVGGGAVDYERLGEIMAEALDKTQSASDADTDD